MCINKPNAVGTIMVTTYLMFTLITGVATNIILYDSLYYSGFTCQLPQNSYYRRFETRCSCQEDCARYGDCCLNSEFFVPEQQIWGASPFSCEYLGGLAYYVIKSCPKKWEDLTILQECQQPDSSFQDPMLNVPVTSNRTNITYYNSYCAICNEDFDPTSDLIWNAQFVCPRQYGGLKSGTHNEVSGFSNWGSSEQFNSSSFADFSSNTNINWSNSGNPNNGLYSDITYGHGDYNINDTSSYNFGHLSQADGSNISFYEDEYYDNNLLNFSDSKYRDDPFPNVPEPLVADLYFDYETMAWYLNSSERVQECYVQVMKPRIMETGILKACKGVIGNCSSEWNDSVVRNRCESYTDLWCAMFATYRNPFCAYCNFVNLSDHYTCWLPERAVPFPAMFPARGGGGGGGGWGGGFSVLLDWSSLPSGKECSGSEKYDPLKKICRTLNNTNYTNHTEQDENSGSALDNITLVFLSISILCLVMHLLVFLGTPKLRNLPAMNLASLSISLLLLYACFIASGFLQPPCVALAVIMHYVLLCCFNWMFVIAFDVWKAIRGSTTNLRFSSGTKWTRFAVYSINAWLMPAILVAVSFSIQAEDFRPGYGESNCWINNKYALILFVVAPLCVVMFLNLWFFAWTAWLIRSTRVSDSTAANDFRLFVRLALIMGLTWATGLIAGVSTNGVMWYLFVGLNTLQGLFIFIAFSCTKKMWRELSRTMRLPRTLTSSSQTVRTVITSQNRNTSVNPQLA